MVILKTDPYKDQLMETSKLVAGRLNGPEWSFCFQSASQSRESWLGPGKVISNPYTLAEIEIFCSRKLVSSPITSRLFMMLTLNARNGLGIEARNLNDVQCPTIHLNSLIASIR